MNTNLLLWIGQILLAQAFLMVGYGHSIGFPQWSVRKGMTWLADVGRDRMRVIAGLETLGAIGLICPGDGHPATAHSNRGRVPRHPDGDLRDLPPAPAR
jgi:hypothetical protein